MRLILEEEGLKNYWTIFRLKIHLHSLVRERDQGLLHLGTKVFQLHQSQCFERDDLKENFQEIASIEDEIDQVHEILYQELGGSPRKPCPSCGKYVDSQARFCPSCGSSLEGSKPE